MPHSIIIKPHPDFDILFLHTFLNKKNLFISRSMTLDMPVMKKIRFYDILGLRNEYKIYEHGLIVSIIDSKG